MSTAVDPAAAPAWELLREELVRFVRRRVGGREAADDIVHDVLLRAHRELRGPRPPERLRPWLYRVTRNAIVDHYRARRPVEELPEEIGSVSSEAEASAERELAGCLGPLFATLAPEDREALTLSEVEGLAQRELAQRAGLSLSGAKSRVQRGRRRLREALLACCEVEVDRRGGVIDFARRAGADCGSASETGAGQGEEPGCGHCAPSR